MSKRSKAIRRQRYYEARNPEMLMINCGMVAQPPLTDFDDYFDDDDDSHYCFHCNNTGYVDCHCGGDLCVCLNYGERECPACGGW